MEKILIWFGIRSNSSKFPGLLFLADKIFVSYFKLPRLKSSEDYVFINIPVTFSFYCNDSLISVTILNQNEGERTIQAIFEK